MPDSSASDRRAVLTADTTLDAERRQIETWRRMSPIDKARLVSQATHAALELAMAGVRWRHPAASERERFLRVAALKLGPALVRLVYPDAAQLRDLGR